MDTLNDPTLRKEIELKNPGYHMVKVIAHKDGVTESRWELRKDGDDDEDK